MASTPYQTFEINNAVFSYTSDDVSWGNSETAQVAVNQGGFVYNSSFEARTCVLSLKGISKNIGDALVQLGFDNKKALARGTATYSDVVLDGRTLKDAVMYEAIPRGNVTVSDTQIYEAVEIKFRSLRLV